jgi:nickel/cobalt exporter
MKKSSMLLLLFLVLLPGLGFAQDNPMFGQRGERTEEGRAIQVTEEANWWTLYVLPVLKSIEDGLENTVRDIKNGEGLLAILIFFGIVFAYGVIHVIGPGHGKVLVSTYIISNDVKAPKIFSMTGLIALLHGGITTVIVLAAVFLLNVVLTTFLDDATFVLQAVSFSLITLFGLYILLNGVFHDWFHKHNLSTCQDPHCSHPEHHHGQHHDHEHQNEPPQGESQAQHEPMFVPPADPQQSLDQFQSQKHHVRAEQDKTLGFWGVVFSVGIVPCTGTMALLIVTVNFNIVLLGVLGMLVMSLGMGISLGLIGLGVYASKDSIVKSIKSKPSFDWHRFSHIFSGGLLFAIGIIYLLVRL